VYSLPRNTQSIALVTFYLQKKLSQRLQPRLQQPVAIVVGVEARKDLEKFFGKQVHLELYVKVNKNWRNDSQQLKRFGYNKK